MGDSSSKKVGRSSGDILVSTKSTGLMVFHKNWVVSSTMVAQNTEFCLWHHLLLIEGMTLRICGWESMDGEKYCNSKDLH